MDVTATTEAPLAAGADTIVVGLVEGEGVAHDHAGVIGPLVESGEAKAGFKKLAVTRADGTRVILVGLGARAQLDPERLRIAAAVALGRAKELGTRRLAWEVPHKVSPAHASALVEGTLLASYEYRAWKSSPSGADDGSGEPDGGLEALILSAHDDVSAAADRGRILAEAANFTRDLQNAPPNEMTPTRLGERAREIENVSVEVWGRDQIEAAGMGAFAGVARGSHEEPALITVRYEPDGASGPVLGLVGKAVTFDSGGISIKPGKGMSDMKFDMSGGAAVLGAMRAIAGLRLPVRVVAVLGATENLPSGHALKPSDILRAKTGTTIEIVNTDAEGRLVLADCLAHAIDQGAERLVDVATLTGGIVVTFGAVHAGLFGTDDAWCEQVTAAGERTGERVWRLPLDPAYDELIKSRYADIMNAVETRQAASITAAQFLARFVGDVPWVHLDIAGVSDGLGRPYAAKGGSGFGVRLLVDLAESTA
jgi:leucyl aminopeptidase